MKTSARPCCRARRDCAVQISKSPFSNGIIFRTAPPASIGALVGKRIRWSGKCPKNMTAKYMSPMTSNFQAVEKFLASHLFSPRNTRIARKEADQEGHQKVFHPSSAEIFRVLSGVSWAKDDCDEATSRQSPRSADHCCCGLGRKRDMIASSTITTNASAPQKM